MAKKLTHEEFLERFYKKNDRANDIEILGTYVNRRSVIHCRCKVDGHEWHPIAGTLLENQGCPKCANQKTSKRLHMPFDSWVKKYHEKYPDTTIQFLGEIKVGKYYKIQCKCSICEHEWTARAIDLFERGTQCSRCIGSGGQLRTHEEFVKIFNRKSPHKGKIEFLSQYTSADEPIRCLCKECGYEWETTPVQLSSALRGCKQCSLKTRSEKLQKPISVFLDKLKDCYFCDNISFDETQYVAMKKEMEFTCKIDGHKWITTPYRIIHSKHGCPICADKDVVKSLTKTHEQFVEDLKQVNPYYEVLTRYKTSKEKILVKCTLCGHEQWARPNDLMNGKNCSYCSDGISYPNKFAHAFLKQLPIENVIYEYSPEWACNKRYDNYFEYKDKAYIVEMDGKQHFMDMSTSNWGSLESNQINDKLKDKLARENDVIMIRIKCKDTYKSYISNEILKSELANIFDLSNIDWKQCDYFARSNLVKEVWDYYNSHPTSIAIEIAKEFCLSVGTIRKYLNRGNKLGICVYNRKEVCKRMKLSKLKEG